MATDTLRAISSTPISQTWVVTSVTECVPGFRHHGYATSILRQSLAVATSLGLARVLVTCDADNVGSAKVIEQCDGVLGNVVPGRDGSEPRRRYWVEVKPAGRE